MRLHMATTVTSVVLKDGSIVSETDLVSVSMALKELYEGEYLALFDLVKKCRNAGFQIPTSQFGDSKKVLLKHKLVNEDGQVHDDVRKIVLNSIQGSGLELKLVSLLSEKGVSMVKERE